MDRSRCLDILNLKPGATKDDIQMAYHDLVKVWHPDRFGHDPALAMKAQEKLKEINAAHAALMKMPVPERPSGDFRPPASKAARKRGLFHDSFIWFLVFALCGLILFGFGLAAFHGAFYNPHPGKSLQEIA